MRFTVRRHDGHLSASLRFAACAAALLAASNAGSAPQGRDAPMARAAELAEALGGPLSLTGLAAEAYPDRAASFIADSPGHALYCVLLDIGVVGRDYTSGDLNGDGASFTDLPTVGAGVARASDGIPDVAMAELIARVWDEGVDLSVRGGADSRALREAFTGAIAAMVAAGARGPGDGVGRVATVYYHIAADTDAPGRAMYAATSAMRLQRVGRRLLDYNADRYAACARVRAWFGAEGDADGDGVSNLAEWNAVWVARSWDADGDGRVCIDDWNSANYAGDGVGASAAARRRADVAAFVLAALDSARRDDGGVAPYPVPEGGDPLAPRELEASRGAYKDRVVVNWLSSPKAVHYEVLRNTGTSLDGASVIAIVTEPFYSDLSAPRGEPQYYWVRASDGQRVSAVGEPVSGWTRPPDRDSDGDGLLDREEDLDGNGVVDAGESAPLDPDTDGDGVGDGLEVAYGTDPLDGGDVPAAIPAVGVWSEWALLLVMLRLVLHRGLRLETRSRAH